LSDQDGRWTRVVASKELQLRSSWPEARKRKIPDEKGNCWWASEIDAFERHILSRI